MAAVALLSACDPVCEDKSLTPTDYTAEQLSNAVSFKVYKDEACTEPAGPAEGNWVKFETNPATTVTILTKNAEGAEAILKTGPSGVFKLYPKRGASTDQTVYVRAVNSDNKIVEAEKTVSVWVKGDLEPELKLLLGEAGVKNWMWDFNAPGGSTCWGNGGASGGADYDMARTVGGHWWGVTVPEELVDQLQHSDTGVATGEEYQGAYMTFDEDGNVVSYDGFGKKIRKAGYSLINYNPERNDGWAVATLETTEPAVLFPFSINEEGKTVTKFDVMYLDANHMTLVYTKGNGPGSWGEITHWMFKNATPSVDAFEANGGKWGWATDGAEIWGNAGNSGNGAGFSWNAVDGKWWGVTAAEDLMGQLAHSGEKAYGDEDSNAYMIFKDGKITSYKADGTEIRSGNYELELYPEGRANNWELGKLKTTAPAVLFPWSINEGGTSVTEFDFMYGDADNMTLVYTKGNGAGSWGEITYWRFARK